MTVFHVEQGVLVRSSNSVMGVMFHVGAVMLESVFAGLRELSSGCEAGCFRDAGSCGRRPPRTQPG